MLSSSQSADYRTQCRDINYFRRGPDSRILGLGKIGTSCEMRIQENLDDLWRYQWIISCHSNYNIKGMCLACAKVPGNYIIRVPRPEFDSAITTIVAENRIV